MFNFIFNRKSYSLPNVLKQLTRDQIEYCITCVDNGDYDTILEAAEGECNI